MEPTLLKGPREFTEEQLNMANSAGIQFPTILPLFRSPPNKTAIQDWVSRHGNSYRLDFCCSDFEIRQ